MQFQTSLHTAGESSIFDLKMILGSLLACIGFAGYSFIRLMAKKTQQQAENLKSTLDVEEGSPIKEGLLDSKSEKELNASPSLPRKR